MSKSQRDNTLVNCWHENNNFSPKMWNEYAKNGVYIKTDPLTLFDSIPEKIRPLLKNSQHLLLHKIKYIDSYENINPKKVAYIILDNNEHTIKQDKYSNESEYRLIIEVSTLNVRTHLRLNPKDKDLKITGNEDLIIDLKEDDIKPYLNGDKIEGLYLKIDTSIMINEIGIVGDSNLIKIREMCKGKESGLENIPIRIFSEDFQHSYLSNNQPIDV